MKASRELYDTLDVVNTSGYYRENGHIMRVLSASAQELLDRFEKIEYYNKNNFSSTAG